MTSKDFAKYDAQHIKQDWQERGFSFGIWDDPLGQIWADFTHDVDELFMLQHGKVELIIAGKTIKPKIGEEILLPANAVHTVKNISTSDSRWYYGYQQNR